MQGGGVGPTRKREKGKVKRIDSNSIHSTQRKSRMWVCHRTNWETVRMKRMVGMRNILVPSK